MTMGFGNGLSRLKIEKMELKQRGGGSNVSLPLHQETHSKPNKKDGFKRRKKSDMCLANICEVAFSERVRRLVWLATLIVIFFMERRRTYVRSKLDLTPARVISGIIMETPDDTIPSTSANGYVRVAAGSRVFAGTPPCYNLRDVDEQRCYIHFPFVDLREFSAKHPKERMKQVLKANLTALPGLTDLAVLTQTGLGVNHEHGNQDRVFMLAPFYPFTVPGRPTDFLLALMDGHGSEGHLIAEATMRDFPVVLTRELRKAAQVVQSENYLHALITDVMVKTFRKVDRHVPDAAASGTTLTVALKLGQHLHVANVGDSRTFIVTYHPQDGSAKILYGTSQDTPDDAKERQRILDRGGSLWLPPVTARGVQPPPRVFMELRDEKNETTTLALRLSRSIGDRAASEVGVICDPKVATVNIDGVMQKDPSVQIFVFSASDGVLEKMAAQTIADRLAASLYRGFTVTPLETVEGIFLDINEIWTKSRTYENGQLRDYRDDMTVAVAKVRL